MLKKLLVISLSFLIVGCYETEKGEKIGVISKISEEGIIFKTYEVTLIRGGINDGSGAFSGNSHFSVENTDTIKKIQDAINHNRNVKIQYHKEWITAFWRGNENYFIDDIS